MCLSQQNFCCDKNHNLWQLLPMIAVCSFFTSSDYLGLLFIFLSFYLPQILRIVFVIFLFVYLGCCLIIWNSVSWWSHPLNFTHSYQFRWSWPTVKITRELVKTKSLLFQFWMWVHWAVAVWLHLRISSHHASHHPPHFEKDYISVWFVNDMLEWHFCCLVKQMFSRRRKLLYFQLSWNFNKKKQTIGIVFRSKSMDLSRVRFLCILYLFVVYWYFCLGSTLNVFTGKSKHVCCHLQWEPLHKSE